MATKKIDIPADNWSLLNNGGEVTQSRFLLKLKEGNCFFGVTENDTTEPQLEDCYNDSEGILYTGSEYVWAKSSANTTATGIIDGID